MRLPRFTVLLAATFLLAAPLLQPGAARADAGIYLSWNDCPSSAASSAGLMGACVNTSQEELVVSFELASATDEVIALEAVVDVESAETTLPSWWTYSPGGCRYNSLIESSNFLDRSACADFWQGEATLAGPPSYYAGLPHGGANQARIVMSFALLSSRARSLTGGTRYYGGRLLFRNDSTTACRGCEIPACLVLNSVQLVRVPGAVGGDLRLETPGAPNSNRATWQSPLADCSAVPVRRVSWGRLKMLYR